MGSGRPVDYVGDAWRAGAEASAYRVATALSEPLRKINNRLVCGRPGRPDGEQQHRTIVADTGLTHVATEQVSDIVAGTEDVGNHKLEPKGLNDVTYRLRDIDCRVKSLGEKQGNNYCPRVASVGELVSGCAEIGLREVEICRHCGDLCLPANSGHQPLDAAPALRVSAAVGKPDQRRVRMTQSGQRVSRWEVCVRHRGQNFFSSRRSGSLRRFFLVM